MNDKCAKMKGKKKSGHAFKMQSVQRRNENKKLGTWMDNYRKQNRQQQAVDQADSEQGGSVQNDITMPNSNISVICGTEHFGNVVIDESDPAPMINIECVTEHQNLETRDVNEVENSDSFQITVDDDDAYEKTADDGKIVDSDTDSNNREDDSAYENDADVTIELGDLNIEDKFNPQSIVGKKLNVEEKLTQLNLKPRHPTTSYLKTKTNSKTNRHCSEGVFTHSDGTNRSWLTYCLEKDALYCIPCMLFSDAVGRGENLRANQGNAFSVKGYTNWKKQFQRVKEHEASASHVHAAVSAALFRQEKSMNHRIDEQNEAEKLQRKREVEANRKVMLRIVDTILLLGKQELAFRGHNESLASDTSTNVGNFLETLKFLAKYDEVIDAHIKKVQAQHEILAKKKIGTKKRDKSRRFGRGNKLTFLSNDIQTKLIDIISKEIISVLTNMISDCMAWALIADTTPDVSKDEQLSICVRIVGRDGSISEHLLFCLRVSSTTSTELFKSIRGQLEEHGIQFDNLVAQTYDGASNMSGKYNGLQQLVKEVAGEKVLFVHCYAHTLNLVLSDVASASLEIGQLFDCLQKLYVIFSKSQPIGEVFKKYQEEAGLPVLAVKRINTVRWNAREFSLDLFLKRYDCIQRTLYKVSIDQKFDTEKRSTASSLHETFSTKNFLACAYLFREIFATTGPLSRLLQSVNIDFGKALSLIDSSLAQLIKLRDSPENVIGLVDKDFVNTSWKEKRIVRRRLMPGETSRDEPHQTAEMTWRANVFCVAIDSVISGIKNRFEKSRHVLEAFDIFSPNKFKSFSRRYKTCTSITKDIAKFCDTYAIDQDLCAKELYSFANSFHRFSISSNSISTTTNDDNDIEDDTDFENEIEAECFVNNNDGDDNDEETVNEPTFIDCFQLLTNETYKLYDAYPILRRVYAIIVAIPISSSSAERSFSTLKRIKTRLRSSMLQGRLQGLMLMSNERKILSSLKNERIVDLLGRSSTELGKALL